MGQGLIERVGAVGSTQDLAHQRAAAGAPHGAVIVATEQREGRGTRGRSWSAPPGGLWLSMIARPAASGLDCLSVRIGLATAEALDALVAPERIMLKWPNDLMVKDRKAGGVLVETRWNGDRLGWVVVGVGLNVVNPIPADLADRAISLAAVAAVALPAAEEAVLTGIRAACDQAEPQLDAGELDRFASRDWLTGRLLANGARCDGIDNRGRLVVRMPDGGQTSRLTPLDWADLAGPIAPA